MTIADTEEVASPALELEVMTSETSEPEHAEWEIVCEPGVRVGWVLRSSEFPTAVEAAVTADGTDDGTVRGYAATLLEVEQQIADRVADLGNAVSRIVHTFGGRDVHLRDGSRIEYRWEPVISDWRCLDCGVDTDAIDEYYMVLDPIWEQATHEPDCDGHLCIECIERRLGRALQASDFSARDINTNTDMPRSPRLTARLQDHGAEA